jgi:hypothetical protein
VGMLANRWLGLAIALETPEVLRMCGLKPVSLPTVTHRL